MANKTRGREEIVINLAAGIAIRSVNGEDLEEKPLPKSMIYALENLFEKDSKKPEYAEVLFGMAKNRSKLEKLMVRYEDGSVLEKSIAAKEAEDMLKPEEIEKVVKLSNLLFRRDMVLVPSEKLENAIKLYNELSRKEEDGNGSKPSKEFKKIVIVKGNVIDPKTGKKRPINDQDALDFLSYLIDASSDENFIISEEMLKILDEVLRYLMGD
ncbi:MAG: hypothetical protein ACP5NE_02535 [Candidatus Micrarchaeia archaeon]